MARQVTPTRQYISKAKLAAMLDVDSQTIDRYIAEEGLPVVKLTTKTHRFEIDAVYAWLDSRCSRRAPASTVPTADDEAAA
jgi:predicted DNA-binding transcriptional regulator AlpA